MHVPLALDCLRAGLGGSLVQRGIHGDLRPVQCRTVGRAPWPAPASSRSVLSL